MYVWSGTTDIQGGTFSSNTSLKSGGGIAFMVSGVLCLIAGIIKFTAHLMGHEIEEIGIHIGAYSASAVTFLPLSILIGIATFIVGWLLWKLTIVIIKSISKGKEKLNA